MSENLKALIRDVPDFPEPGILFRDITPLLGNAAALRQVVDWLATTYQDTALDAVIGVESRGFIFGAPLAERLGLGFVPVRKPGKLPADRHVEEYALEYGMGVLEIHQDALRAGQRVVIVDDLLATGGTVAACCELLEQCGATVVGCSFLIDLTFLEGSRRLAPRRVTSVIQY